MSILVFDTETTGLYPGQICQLSYVTEDKGAVDAKNFFFMVDYIDPGASAVNGLSVDKLLVLSDGHEFSDDADEIAADFARADLVVAHNFSFDYSFLNTEFKRAGRQLVYREDFCTMRKFTPVCGLIRPNARTLKYPKLSELMQYLWVTEEETLALAESLFGACTGYHDARFDTAGLYLAVKKGAAHFKVLTDALE